MFQFSVTEDEILHGIVYDHERQRQICMLRNIFDLDQHLGHRKAMKYIDLVGGNKVIDQEAQNLLAKLRDDTIPKLMDTSYSASFSVPWSNNSGINSDDHKDYLDSFCNSFYDIMSKQIQDNLAQKDVLLQNALFVEVLQHLNTCHARCQSFRGRGAILARIKGYLMNPAAHPFIVHGDSGSGKTSIMAVAASKVLAWFPKKTKPVLIVRFLGKCNLFFQDVPLVCVFHG